MLLHLSARLVERILAKKNPAALYLALETARILEHLGVDPSALRDSLHCSFAPNSAATVLQIFFAWGHNQQVIFSASPVNWNLGESSVGIHVRLAGALICVIP